MRVVCDPNLDLIKPISFFLFLKLKYLLFILEIAAASMKCYMENVLLCSINVVPHLIIVDE